MRTKFFDWLIIFLWGKSSIVDSNMWIPTSCSNEIVIHWVRIHSIYWNRFSGTNRICSVSSPRYGSWIFLDKQFGRLRFSNIHVVKNSIFSTGYECMRALKYKYFQNKNVIRGLKINMYVSCGIFPHANSIQELFTCGRRANLFDGPLCWAKRLVDLHTPVVLKTASRTWPSLLVETRWVSPVRGKNLDWKTFEWWPEGKETDLTPFSQSHTIISLSSDPDARRLPDSLKCNALTQPCKARKYI